MASTAIPSEESPLLNNQSSAPVHGQNGEEVAENGGIAADDDPSTIYLLKSTVGVFLGALVAAIDSSMIATLSTPISESFGSLSRLSWLVSAFFIATIAVQPLSGKLTDIYGRKTGVILSNIVFIIGNLVCALSQSESSLICGRLIAGIGGGGLLAITTFIISDLVPLRRRGIWQGLGNVFFGAGSGIGGFFGGWINDTLGWRAAFALQVPITVLAIILIYFTINIPIVDVGMDSKFRRIDFLGATTLFTTLVLLLFALSSGGNIFPWSHPVVLISFPLSFGSLLGFLLVELKFAILFYLPVFLQVQGYSPTKVGLRLIAGSVTVAVTSVACGILVRWTGRYHKIGIFSQVIYLASMAMIATFDLRAPAWPPYVYFAIVNIGFGAMLTATTLALLSAVEQKHQAVITSALFAFRSTSTVLGIAIASLTFQNILRYELWKRLGGIDDAAEKIKGVIADIGAIGRLNIPCQEQALQAYMTALRAVFLVLCGMSALGVVASFMISDRELPSKMTRRPSN